MFTAGAGKTKLTSRLVDFISSQLDPKEAIAYFYCDRNRPDHRDPAAVLRSLTRQLSANDVDIHVDIHAQWGKNMKDGFPLKELSFEVCKGLFQELLSGYKKTTIALDGLDECDEETRYELIHFLNNLVQEDSYLVKVFIASRNDQDLWDSYIKSPHFHIEANHNSDDIRRFVLHSLETTTTTWWREKLPSQTKKAILETFEAKSDGM